ncbi:MAG: HNH endonuclease [Actinomycetota bacterium]
MLAGVIEAIRAVEVNGMTRRLLEDAIEELHAVENAAAARRLAAMAALDSLRDGGLPSSTVSRARGKTSDRKAKQAAKTASALGGMPRLRKKLDRGEITEEHADAAAQAAERSGDADKTDRELNKLADAPADLFDKRADDWASRNESQEKIDARARRQRRNRTVVFGRSKDDGSWSMYATGETSEGAALRGLIDEESDRLFREDGGRENLQRPRTDDQRRFDALANLIRRGAGQTESSGSTRRRPHPKYEGVVSIPLSAYLDPSEATGERIGSGPLPSSMIQRLLCDGRLRPVIVDDDGSPLWLGRSSRTASDDQWKALVVRDGGCVVCGAHPSRCEAHHLVFWEHRGSTDIDNLVLLCTRHHRQLHDHDLALRRRNDTWVLGPREGPAPPPTRRPRRRPANRSRRTARPARAV